MTAEQEDASARALGRRDPIYAGDRIRTRARARVQIRFEDGALVDLDPSSTFEVEEYASDDDGGGGSAVMSFLKGAMRTITGAIGGGREDTYRMTTTVATIGVRGTAYALEYCDAECAGEDGQVGLYGRVDDGDVEVEAPGGTGTFGKGHYFFVPEGGAPERIVAPPDGILEGEGETGAGGDDDRIEDVSIKPLDTGEEDGLGIGGTNTDLLDPDFESAETTDLGEPRPGDVAEVLFGGGFVGSDARGTDLYRSDAEAEARLGSDSEIVGAEFDAGFVDTSDLNLVENGTKTITNPSNGDPLFAVDWGRWQGAPEIAGGADGGFTYAYADLDRITTPTELDALTGTFFFDSASGDGPAAVDQNGGTYDVSASVQLDFFNATIDQAFLNFSGPNTFSVNGDGDLNPDATFTVNNLQSTDEVFNGNLEGVLLGSNAEGAIIVFDVEGAGTEIVGTQVLQGDGGLN
ncbi:FecR family protein [Halofilum ochraceum]|uniref:FecR family protein n=1 Tax=Halofilum ochraceum TaxID=1611323 RepID=UPI00158616CC|nr:FecR family protein [Halofilum ochraceum]